MAQITNNLKMALVDATGWIWSESESGFWVGRTSVGLTPIATVMTDGTRAGGIIRAKGIQTKCGSVGDVLDWFERHAPAATKMMRAR